MKASQSEIHAVHAPSVGCECPEWRRDAVCPSSAGLSALPDGSDAGERAVSRRLTSCLACGAVGPIDHRVGGGGWRHSRRRDSVGGWFGWPAVTLLFGRRVLTTALLRGDARRRPLTPRPLTTCPAVCQAPLAPRWW